MVSNLCLAKAVGRAELLEFYILPVFTSDFLHSHLAQMGFRSVTDINASLAYEDTPDKAVSLQQEVQSRPRHSPGKDHATNNLVTTLASQDGCKRRR